MADGPYDAKGPVMRPDMAGPDGVATPEVTAQPYASESMRILSLTAAVVLGISRTSAIRFNGRALNISLSYLS